MIYIRIYVIIFLPQKNVWIFYFYFYSSNN